MLLKLIFFFPSNQESSCSSMGNTPSGYLVGMKCSHTGHPFPHRLLLFLTQGIGPLQRFHSSETWGDYHFLERIITSHSLPQGIITSQRGLSPLSHYTGGLSSPREWGTVTSGGLSPPHLSFHYPRGLPTPTQSDLLFSSRVLHPFSPQLFLFSCLLSQ